MAEFGTKCAVDSRQTVHAGSGRDQLHRPGGLPWCHHACLERHVASPHLNWITVQLKTDSDGSIQSIPNHAYHQPKGDTLIPPRPDCKCCIREMALEDPFGGVSISLRQLQGLVITPPQSSDPREAVTRIRYRVDFVQYQQR